MLTKAWQIYNKIKEEEKEGKEENEDDLREKWRKLKEKKRILMPMDQDLEIKLSEKDRKKMWLKKKQSHQSLLNTKSQ